MAISFSVIITIVIFKDTFAGLQKDCGRQAIKPHLNYDRIISGVPAEPHSWPWQVSLYGLGPEFTYLCGGSIISANWILTVAHCFFPAVLLLKPEVWNVRAGEIYHDIFTNGVQLRQIDEIIIHEKYSWPQKPYDIALLKLKAPLVLNKNVQPICIPPHHFSPPSYMMCYVAGWPDIIAKKNEPFHQITLPIIPQETCTREDYYGEKITKSMLCAGWEQGGKDACKGDSGRPLMCLVKDRWIVVGIASWGKACGLPKKPGVFTNVSFFLEWIENRMEQE